MSKYISVKYIVWDQTKNIQLMASSGVRFEDVLTAFEENRVLADIRHHNITQSILNRECL